jgi:hypothetical protein
MIAQQKNIYTFTLTAHRKCNKIRMRGDITVKRKVSTYRLSPELEQEIKDIENLENPTPLLL